MGRLFDPPFKIPEGRGLGMFNPSLPPSLPYPAHPIFPRTLLTVRNKIYATPNSRDGHIARNKIHGFKEKVRELSGKK